MGLFKPEFINHDEFPHINEFMGWEIEGIACACCERKSHNPFTWITCRIQYIDATFYLSSPTYQWFSDKWDDFKERFVKEDCGCGHIHE